MYLLLEPDNCSEDDRPLTRRPAQGRGKIERFFVPIDIELPARFPGHIAPGVPAPTPFLDLAPLDQALDTFITHYTYAITASLV